MGLGKKIKKDQLLCVFASLVLMTIVFFSGKRKISDGIIERNGYGGSVRKIEAVVKAVSGKIPVEIRVSPKRYSYAEAKEAIEELKKDIEEIISQGQSLTEIRGDLYLPEEFEGGIKASWTYVPCVPEGLCDEEILEFRKRYRNLIEENGKLNTEIIEEDEIEGDLYLTAAASIAPGEDGEDLYSESIKIHVRVPGKEMSEQEEFERALNLRLEELDMASPGSDVITLPNEILGKRVSFEEKGDLSYMIFPLLGIIAAVLMGMREGKEEEKRRILREKSLRLDYSELIAKLMIYIGAGETIRNSFEKMEKHYSYLIKQGFIKESPLSEELKKMKAEFARNMPEARVYEEFGIRSGLRSYKKLMTILEQNRKNGTRSLRTILKYEMSEAFEERKNMAVRMSEEAGTKLLIPLFLQLGLVMAIVMLPALSSI